MKNSILRTYCTQYRCGKYAFYQYFVPAAGQFATILLTTAIKSINKMKDKLILLFILAIVQMHTNIGFAQRRKLVSQTK